MDFIEVEACPQHGSTSDRSLPTISACSMFPHHIVVPSIPLTFLLPAKVFTPPGLGGKERMVRAAVLPDRSYHHLMYLPEVSWGDLCTLQRTLTLRPSLLHFPYIDPYCWAPLLLWVALLCKVLQVSPGWVYYGKGDILMYLVLTKSRP